MDPGILDPSNKMGLAETFWANSHYFVVNPTNCTNHTIWGFDWGVDSTLRGQEVSFLYLPINALTQPHPHIDKKAFKKFIVEKDADMYLITPIVTSKFQSF